MFSHDVQRQTLVDPRLRPALDRVVLLRVDRTSTYMQDESEALTDAAAEVRRAEARWRPNASKYGTVILLASDCSTERGRAGPDDPIDTRLSVQHMADLLAHATP